MILLSESIENGAITCTFYPRHNYCDYREVISCFFLIFLTFDLGETTLLLQ